MRIARFSTLLILMALGSPAQAETVDCTPVTSLPVTISAQGIYCLTGNLATSQTSGNAITINANNVTLDLNGWKVGGQAAGPGTMATGIYSEAANVTVKNGIVRGFIAGVSLRGRGATVQGITADQNTRVGIYVEGQGSLVQGNQVVDTGGSTEAQNSSAMGIGVMGSGSLVQNNLVSGLMAVGSASEYGVFFYGGAVQSTARNNIVNDAARPTGGGSSNGVMMQGPSAVAVSSNIVTNFTVCVNYASGATGTYSRNTAIGCDTQYAGGTAGSGND